MITVPISIIHIFPYVLGVAVMAFLYLVNALWKWRRASEGFEVTPLGVRSALVDFLDPGELAREDITKIEFESGSDYITVRAGKKSLTLNWWLVELENGERLTAVEAALRMSSILGVPAFTVDSNKEATPLS